MVETLQIESLDSLLYRRITDICSRHNDVLLRSNPLLQPKLNALKEQLYICQQNAGLEEIKLES